MVPKSREDEVAAKITEVRTERDRAINKIISSASAALNKKDYRKARERYSDVLRLEPRNESALSGITRINQMIEEDITRYVAIAKQNVSSNPERAKDYFTRVLNLDPANKDANSGIERLTGRTSQVKIDANQVRVLYYEGVDNYVNGEIEKAIRIWENVLKIDKEHTEARKNIARAKEKLKAIRSLTE